MIWTLSAWQWTKFAANTATPTTSSSSSSAPTETVSHRISRTRSRNNTITVRSCPSRLPSTRQMTCQGKCPPRSTKRGLSSLQAIWLVTTIHQSSSSSSSGDHRIISSHRFSTVGRVSIGRTSLRPCLTHRRKNSSNQPPRSITARSIHNSSTSIRTGPSNSRKLSHHACRSPCRCGPQSGDRSRWLRRSHTSTRWDRSFRNSRRASHRPTTTELPVEVSLRILTFHNYKRSKRQLTACCRKSLRAAERDTQ